MASSLQANSQMEKEAHLDKKEESCLLKKTNKHNKKGLSNAVPLSFTDIGRKLKREASLLRCNSKITCGEQFRQVERTT